jgi:predicted Zn-dependent protease
MKRLLFMSLIIATAAGIGCTKNQITGRKQLSLIPESQLRTMAVQEYKSFLTQNKVITNGANKDAEMVKRVGGRIAKAITDYYTQQGKAALMQGYNWEFNLVDDNQVNAWCMPGGKVVVYTGLLPIAQNEAALAIVMGHEISHAIAGHGGERMSQGMFAQGLGMVGDIVTSKNPKINSLFGNIYGIGAQAGYLLPNSRAQELEADHYGLLYAAMAGYNPKEAIAFWERMSKAGGQKPPEFLATHPSDARRIAQLQTHMDEALKFYQATKK